MSNNRALLISGAGSAIAAALLQHLAQTEPTLALHALSRQPATAGIPDSVQWHVTDYSDDDLIRIRDAIAAREESLEYLVIANGVLHEGAVRPERALRELSQPAMEQVFAVNTFLPMRVIAAMTPLLRKANAPKIAAFSARVGSISDNGLGGWYSYRASKAALNMMLKSAAVEFKRLNRRAKLLAFHPGTTDTPLSKPFQARVDPNKLFTPEFVAERFWQLLEELEPDGELAYRDWAGEPIPW
jgi:NAD(P)-dependent dehydrogenase (short-subunit alcohol dehydrogenase family)